MDFDALIRRVVRDELRRLLAAVPAPDAPPAVGPPPDATVAGWLRRLPVGATGRAVDWLPAFSSEIADVPGARSWVARTFGRELSALRGRDLGGTRLARRRNRTGVFVYAIELAGALAPGTPASALAVAQEVVR